MVPTYLNQWPNLFSTCDFRMSTSKHHTFLRLDEFEAKDLGKYIEMFLVKQWSSYMKHKFDMFLANASIALKTFDSYILKDVSIGISMPSWMIELMIVWAITS